MAIALLAPFAIILIAFMKPLKIVFDSDSPTAVK
jgi:hypothetical protein